MKDNWKKFAEDHQEEFNNETPRDLFHEKVAPFIPMEKRPRMVPLRSVMRVAAALVVLIGVTLFFVLQKGETTSGKTVAGNKIPDENSRLVLARLDPNLAEAEYYYVTQIDKLMKEVESRQLSDEVKELIQQLDIEFKVLKKEMGDRVNSDQIIEALIENYRLKIKLLEKILESYGENNNDSYEKETTI